MSSLRRQNTVYGFLDTAPMGAGFNSIATISNGVCSNINDETNENVPTGSCVDTGSKRGYSARPSPQRRQTTHSDSTSVCRVCGLKPRQNDNIKLRKLLLLMVTFILYVSLGAVVFNNLESGPERSRKEKLEEHIQDFVDKHPCVNLTEIIELMTVAVQDSELVYYVANNKKHLNRWDFSGSFGFVVSIVTTIGFGNLAPFTMEGKAVCVCYAIIGIPLTLLVLSAIGQKMAHYFIRIRRLRCEICHHSPVVNKRMNVLFIAVLGFVLLFLLPAAIFGYVEDWHYLEALYYCFTTLSTVGFGDYVIGIHEQKLSSGVIHEVYMVVGYIWVLVGLSYLSLIYRVIMDTVVASARSVGQKTRERLGTDTIRRAQEALKEELTTRNRNGHRGTEEGNDVRYENTTTCCGGELNGQRSPIPENRTNHNNVVEIHVSVENEQPLS